MLEKPVTGKPVYQDLRFDTEKGHGAITKVMPFSTTIGAMRARTLKVPVTLLAGIVALLDFGIAINLYGHWPPHYLDANFRVHKLAFTLIDWLILSVIVVTQTALFAFVWRLWKKHAAPSSKLSG